MVYDPHTLTAGFIDIEPWEYFDGSDLEEQWYFFDGIFADPFGYLRDMRTMCWAVGSALRVWS